MRRKDSCRLHRTHETGIKPDKGEDPVENEAAATASASAENAGAVPEKKADDTPMSFAERKARYERERAAREAAASADAADNAAADPADNAAAEGGDA